MPPLVEAIIRQLPLLPQVASMQATTTYYRASTTISFTFIFIPFFFSTTERPLLLLLLNNHRATAIYGIRWEYGGSARRGTKEGKSG